MRLIGLAVVLTLSLVLAPLAAKAQQAGRSPRLGYVDLGGRDMERSEIRGIRDGLRELGYVEDQTILIEYRFAEGQADRLPGILVELLRSKVDILLTAGTVVTQAAQRATTTVPIVMTVGDPVSGGFANNLARPGGNITGLALQLRQAARAAQGSGTRRAPRRLHLESAGTPGTRGAAAARRRRPSDRARAHRCPGCAGLRRRLQEHP